MSEIAYSANALNVLNKFHRVDITVHVEGDDDIIFWQKVFEITTDKKVGFIPTGGCAELDRRIGLIEAGSLKAIAARDSDYHILKNTSSTNPRIVYSYGYSIENTLYCTSSIAAMCKIACKTANDFAPDTDIWKNSFASSFCSLLSLDLANDIESSGIIVLSDNCSRYMENESSHKPCALKISAKEEEVLPQLDIKSIEAAKNILDGNKFDPWRWLRGHFVASGVQKFISNSAKDAGRKASVAHDHIFGQAILCLHKILTDDIEQHSHYQTSITTALATF